MRHRDNSAHRELLDSLQQRIQTEKSVLQRRLETNPPRPPKRRKKGRASARTTGRLYQVFLALSTPEAEP